MTVLLAPAGILSSLAGIPIKAALSGISSWVISGTQALLAEVIKVINAVTAPSLSVSWFSSEYWKVSALAMLLTLPFLFAAAVQAIVRTDLSLLVRAALFDLPVAAISVTLAAPVITLLLAATDEMCSLVSSGDHGGTGGSFLAGAARDLSLLGTGFLPMMLACVVLIAGLVLLVELIMRAAAIYVVVLFLPLGFAAMVWPARRVWIKRMVELLISLILSKFAMVAVLSLAVTGVTSIGTSSASLTTALSAMALMVLAALSPWALLKLLPFTEVAAETRSLVQREHDSGLQRAQSAATIGAQVGTGAIIDPIGDGFGILRSFMGEGGAGFGQGESRSRDAAPPARPDARNSASANSARTADANPITGSFGGSSVVGSNDGARIDGDTTGTNSDPAPGTDGAMSTLPGATERFDSAPPSADDILHPPPGPIDNDAPVFNPENAHHRVNLIEPERGFVLDLSEAADGDEEAGA